MNPDAAKLMNEERVLLIFDIRAHHLILASVAYELRYDCNPVILLQTAYDTSMTNRIIHAISRLCLRISYLPLCHEVYYLILVS